MVISILSLSFPLFFVEVLRPVTNSIFFFIKTSKTLEPKKTRKNKAHLQTDVAQHSGSVDTKNERLTTSQIRKKTIDRFKISIIHIIFNIKGRGSENDFLHLSSLTIYRLH